MKIVVGMSGGVDSSVSLILLKNMGFDPIGVSLKLPVWENPKNLLRENTCCTKESLETAKKICEKLHVPFYIFDVQKEFIKEVINYFINELKRERTPNPCIICNRYLKFKQLFEFAKKMDIKNVATGHYAKIRLNSKTKKYELLKARDKEKDQSYYLAFLSHKWLENIYFPLGDIKKKETCQIAKDQGLEHLLSEKESQDFCFVAGKSLNSFLTEKIGIKRGNIINKHGHILGEHKGIHFYTIGQRKGLNTPWHSPLYVQQLDLKTNNVLVTDNPDDLLSRTFSVEELNWLSDNPSDKIDVLSVQIRYNSKPIPVEKIIYQDKTIKVILRKPTRAITPGQSAVFYKGNQLLGGGMIQ